MVGVVRWVRRFRLAADLNRRGEPTAHGERWGIPSVLRLLDSRHVPREIYAPTAGYAGARSQREEVVSCVD